MRAEDNVVLVTDMNSVTENVMNVLKSKEFENAVYIVVQNEKIFSVAESKLLRKKNAIRKNKILIALEREKKRIFVFKNIEGNVEVGIL